MFATKVTTDPCLHMETRDNAYDTIILTEHEDLIYHSVLYVTSVNHYKAVGFMVNGSDWFNARY